MRIDNVKVQNFRLLANVEMALESQTTLVVGRNNSGKTSLSEVMRRFLDEGTPTFQLEDFSSASYDAFCAALKAKHAGATDKDVRGIIPSIELSLIIEYDASQSDLGVLSDFVIDLDPTVTKAAVIVRYELRDGAIDSLFEGQPGGDLSPELRREYFRVLRERIPQLFSAKVWAQDPNDQTNQRPLALTDLRPLIKTGFVNAQRGLDDNTARDADVLARILEGLFVTAKSPTADADDRAVAKALEEAVKGIQQKLDEDFSGSLKTLMPTFQTFGYPGLGGPELQTETILDVKRLLSNNTRVRYAGYSGVSLPEAYNGLGARNLIFILLQLVGFYKLFRADETAPGINLIFIEEPEAHLHPQMQEVFIRQLSKLAAQLNAGSALPWPVQFVVSTHSSHVANAANFESIRYFLSVSAATVGVRNTKIKDLRRGMASTPAATKKFLHQYLTLTRCDLFFADKAVLVEGTGERVLLPIFIKKLEEAKAGLRKLSTQYVTMIEVGGAYAHLFFDLLRFLELRCLIITDLDSVGVGGKACAVHLGSATSNACINAWFDANLGPPALLAKTDDDKVKDQLRIAYQRPEEAGGPCGRSLEDAFLLANMAKFGITGATPADKELSAFEAAASIKKSAFALRYALDDNDWASPGYISDGLEWLAAADGPNEFGAVEVPTAAAA